jgi:hypothetical protein
VRDIPGTSGARPRDLPGKASGDARRDLREMLKISLGSSWTPPADVSPGSSLRRSRGEPPRDLSNRIQHLPGVFLGRISGAFPGDRCVVRLRLARASLSSPTVTTPSIVVLTSSVSPRPLLVPRRLLLCS